MKKQPTYFFVFVMLVMLLLLPFDGASQCAMCKSAAETSLKNNPGSIARGLNSGILYLMAVPYLMILFIFRKQVLQLWKALFKKSAKAE